MRWPLINLLLINFLNNLQSLIYLILLNELVKVVFNEFLLFNENLNISMFWELSRDILEISNNLVEMLNGYVIVEGVLNDFNLLFGRHVFGL